MTWSNVPDSGPHHTDAERRAWEQGGTTLFPVGRIADRVSTVLILSAGALVTIVTTIIAVIAVLDATASCAAATGCSPGRYFGGAAIAVIGSFVLGLAAVVLSITAWIRRRASWWIAAVGFVLVVGCVVWGGVVFTQSDDGGASSSSGPVI